MKQGKPRDEQGYEEEEDEEAEKLIKII